MKSSDLVITGVGMVSSIGVGRKAFTESLLGGISGVRRLCDDSSDESEHVTRRYRFVEGEPALDEETAVVAGLDEFDPKQFVKPRKALKVMCREIQTAYAASQLAVEDAGLQPYLPAESVEGMETDRHRAKIHQRKRPCYTKGGKIQSDRIGTVFGSELLYGAPEELADAFADCMAENGKFDPSQFGNAAMRRITPLWLLKYLPNMPACHFSIVLGAHGPNNSITVGDTSGQAALIEACGYLRREIADFMVVSASGSRLNATRALFTEDQPLAKAMNPASHSSRPHACDADGIVRGEGAGGLMIERADMAAARGIQPIARVTGYASRFIPSVAFATDQQNADLRPDAGRGNVDSIVAAMNGAMKSAGITADQIGAVVGHAVGDPVLDACERDALNQVAPNVPLVLPATLLGHTGAASGMMGLLAACIVMQTGKIAPVPHAKFCVEKAAAGKALNVSDQIRPLEKRVVMAIAYTSPGNATAVILQD
ncbi:beta-ketoacyl-[acyl-carrier-protein] synthase family protein [Aporhodopirellula aestuarii]|uniref:3-oxoacyl-ACP synthase n=1 Tax=Aporhodopirellula aestuarii TaxID=2950107 RepID=A0ABT0TZT0_9BACT|nr:beta-ketoacyl synthase N-terminal-like domain-containing protein [Aporhodopirellula aestuarii]MCM2370114.1 3-oxoacyl-ACP synthase [Aporhodopirellula aestuarii]